MAENFESSISIFEEELVIEEGVLHCPVLRGHETVFECFWHENPENGIPVVLQ